MLPYFYDMKVPSKNKQNYKLKFKFVNGIFYNGVILSQYYVFRRKESADQRWTYGNHLFLKVTYSS